MRLLFLLCSEASLSRHMQGYLFIYFNVVGRFHGDHLSGKSGNVRDFGRCRENIRDFTKSQGKILSGKIGQKLLIVSCLFVSVQAVTSIQVVLALYECHLTWAE